ncbi:MAG: FAD-dependent oxidoreductase [Pseudomonadota bacterium]
MSRIAIIGAGLAGLVIARELQGRHELVLFEKARGVGGRMATRYAGEFRFDHGAQFFTARSSRFRRFLAPFIEDGTVARWQARFAEHTRSTITATRQWGDDYPHYVGAPGMNALPKRLAETLDVRLQTRIVEARRTADGWRLTDDAGNAHDADWLVVTAPGPQTRALLADHMPDQAAAPSGAMKACYAVMLAFDETQPTSFDASRVLDADISWISVNSSKPGRDASFTMVVHATNAWADANTDIDLDVALSHLLSEFEAVSGLDASNAVHTDIHRWRYANTARQDGAGYALNVGARLGICGDWLIRGRVEAAFQSAMRLADSLGDDLVSRC